MRVLLVEDDEQLATRLGDRLRSAGLAVDVTRSREEGEAWPDMERLAAVILDLGLPDGSGMDLLRFWREREIETPILILTARGSWQDKVEGLNAGADDFVVKPVRFEELQARLNALQRRQNAARASLLDVGDLSLDPQSQIASLGGQPLDLSRREFALLHLFMRRPQQVLSQGSIMEDLYDLEAERELNTVEVLVGRLRRKIGRERITTVRGLGYRLNR